jgi:hypothetical protein
MYSSVYKHGQPDQERSKQIRQETFQRFFTRRTCLSLAQQQGNERGASVASCLVWNNNHDGNKSPILNDKMTNIVIPTAVQAPVVANNYYNNTTSCQRAQSAGPRLISTASNQPPPLPQKPVQMLKSPITTTERPHTATTTSREHYTGANFGPKISIPRPTAPYEQTYANQMQNLISKYM